MKSRISFFNIALFKKDITRFAPLWVLYTVGMSLMMLTTYAALGKYYGPVRELGRSIGGYSVINLFYGALAAQLLFGDLFNSRLCNALHAMPMTREAGFGSHVTAGLAFSIVPNLVISLLIMPSFGQYWYLPLAWLGSMTLQYVFFFSVGILAVFCTGNRFAMTVVYVIINFCSIMVYWFMETVYLPMMPGVVLNTDIFSLFSPVVQMCSVSNYFRLTYETALYMTPQYRFNGLGDGWWYLLICAGVGVVLLAASLQLYRKRALESAGDFIAVSWLRPVFLVLYTLCAGAFVAIFGDLFSSGTYVIFLIVGLIVGFFTGKMLLERTARVFSKKSFVHLAVMTVAILLSIGAVKYDLLGVTRYVPKPEAVETVTVACRYGDLQMENYGEIDQVCNVHRLALKQTCEGDLNGKHTHVYATITYQLRGGQTVERRYRLCQTDDAYFAFRVLYNQKGLPIE